MKTITSAVASAVVLSSAASAAGLGKLTVLSSLGQPLRAEIELTSVSADDASGLAAKVATPDAFRAANIDFNPALTSLRFAIEQRGGRQLIRISSTQPVNEPFVDLLLELSWNSGRLVREYTFLLDPPELRATQSAQVAAAAAPAAARQPVAAPSGQVFRPAAPDAQAAAPSAPQPKSKAERPARAADASRAPTTAPAYKVRPGDTLGRIAAQIKPVDISLDMMLVALYRANPDAFIGHNMNRLKSGQILAVPDSDSIRGSGEGDAHGVVIAHAADFNAYRNKLAGQVASAAPTSVPEAAQSAAGKITAKVEERPTAANESKDRLQLSKAGTLAGAAGKTAAESAEDKIAGERALADATARVKELEKNVNDLERLVVVKNKAAADAVKPAQEQLAPAAKPVAAARPAPRVPAKPLPLQKKAAASEPSFADMLMDNITYVGAGLGVLLLALVGIAAVRRRRQEADPTQVPSILGVPTGQAHSLFAETGGQSVDTNNSVFNSSFAPSASQLDTNEVDPVAEADVYIAYGRDAQAEEILKEALRTQPDRYPVRLKLLEIYAARKDQRAFEAQASEMYAMTKGQGEDWEQAAALGLAIDPLNPLYASAASEAAAPAPTAEEIGEQAVLAQMHDEAPHGAIVDHTRPDLDMNLAAAAAAAAAPGALAGPAEAAPHAAATEDNTLDFDLGGLSFEPISQSAPIAMTGPSASAAPQAGHVPDLDFTSEKIAAAPAPADDPFDMPFDMAFDTPPAAPQAAAGKSLDDIELSTHDLSTEDLSADFDMAAFSKEFDLPASPAQPDASEHLHPLAELDAMNFDLPELPAMPPADAAPADLDAEDPFSLPELPSDPRAGDATPLPHFDMSGIDLELPPSEPYSAAPPPQHDFVADPADSAALSAVHMEMETKLDLAVAYQEIGDKEGARELLDEVIKGGNVEQVSKANDMRFKLA